MEDYATAYGVSGRLSQEKTKRLTPQGGSGDDYYQSTFRSTASNTVTDD